MARLRAGRKRRRGFRLLALRDRLDRRAVATADRDEELVAVLAQQLLHALDGVALVVEHVADALDQLDILRAVVAAAAAALHRLDLREARLPEAQHMLRQVEIFGHFADGAEGVGALVHGAALS